MDKLKQANDTVFFARKRVLNEEVYVKRAELALAAARDGLSSAIKDLETTEKELEEIKKASRVYLANKDEAVGAMKAGAMLGFDEGFILHYRRIIDGEYQVKSSKESAWSESQKSDMSSLANLYFIVPKEEVPE